MNQLTNISEAKKLSDPANADKAVGSRQLMQDSYRNILDIMEQNHEKLYKAVKKKIGMQKTVFDAIVQSGDMFEWSVAAALEAAHKHDTKVIQEADSDDECSQMHQSVLEDRIDTDDVHDLSG